VERFGAPVTGSSRLEFEGAPEGGNSVLGKRRDTRLHQGDVEFLQQMLRAFLEESMFPDLEN